MMGPKFVSGKICGRAIKLCVHNFPLHKTPT